jgi:protein SCO1/2
LTITSVSKALVVAVLALCAALLAACSPSPPAFQNTDLTGADYGKDFALTDHNGHARTLADFKGKVVVLFFGYTHCPDVCPTTMAELNGVLQKLGSDASKVQVLFVTLDPQRDTPQVLAKYVPAFNPAFLGLYGDPAATDRTAKDFKVFYQKVPGTTPDNYTLDHTAASYVFDAQGRLRLFVRSDAPPEALTADLKTLLAAG